MIFTNITQPPDVLALIVKNAFGFDQAAGGALGATLMQGVRRESFQTKREWEAHRMPPPPQQQAILSNRG